MTSHNLGLDESLLENDPHKLLLLPSPSPTTTSLLLPVPLTSPPPPFPLLPQNASDLYRLGVTSAHG